MKTNTLRSAILIATIFFALPSFSQFNPFTNTRGKAITDNPVNQEEIANSINYSPESGVPCVDNSFWAITSGAVIQFSINGDVITNTGTTTITGAFDQNLAYCNNLNGDNFGPTFYSTRSFNEPVYFNGSGGTATGDISPVHLINCGGSGNFLYYIMYDSAYKASAIERYDGSNFSTVYSFPDSITVGVADIAVDSSGNAWFFTGPEMEDSIMSDTLNVVSPDGQLIKQYPFVYDTDNGYGCFMLHGKLYIGLGGANNLHPNTLLPITIKADGVIAGTPIPMPVTGSLADLASCSAGSPLSVGEHPLLKGIEIYPNPVIDKLTIKSDSNEGMELFIYDFMAREVLHQSFTGSITLNTAQYSKGMYIYKICSDSGKEVSGKIVKD
jgi:hypothetical protein